MFGGDFSPKVFVHATDIRNQLINKTNYIAETYQVRKAIHNIWIKKPAAAKFTQFIAPSINEIVLGDNHTDDLKKLKSKTVYDIRVIRTTNMLAEVKCIGKPHYNSHMTLFGNKFGTLRLKKLPVNKYKEFRFKLIYNILPNKTNLTKWNLINPCSCVICNVHDDFNHLLLSCKSLKQFWNNIGYLLNLNLRIKHDIKLKEIVVGCNINYINFNTFNLLIIIDSFTVHRTNAE